MAIIIFSVFAAFGFFTAAKKRGYTSSRFWIYPLAVGFSVFTLSLVLSFLFAWAVENHESLLARTFPFLNGMFSLMLFLSWVSREWKKIKNLPSKNSSSPQ